MSADLDPAGRSGTLADSGPAGAAEAEDGASILSRNRSRLARFATGLYRQTLSSQ